MAWKGRDVISILDFKREDLDLLFSKALEFDRGDKYEKILEGKVLALAFFEPSTRTMLSFQAAMQRLGGSVIWFSSKEATSAWKGENLADTIRMLDAYSDCIVIRHKLEGAAAFAAEIAEKPVINGGDGSQHHPTQAMIDLYTIWKNFGRISNLKIGVVGDLRYGRAANSFILGLTLYRPSKLYLVSPPQLGVRSEIRDVIERSKVEFEELNRLEDIISEVDVLYVTRIQKERFPHPEEYEKVKGSYRIDLKILEKAKEDMIILHPLPRVDEISLEVDETPYAHYFQQAKNGIPLRMALLSLIIGGLE